VKWFPNLKAGLTSRSPVPLGCRSFPFSFSPVVNATYSPLTGSFHSVEFPPFHLRTFAHCLCSLSFVMPGRNYRVPSFPSHSSWLFLSRASSTFDLSFHFLSDKSPSFSPLQLYTFLFFEPLGQSCFHSLFDRVPVRSFLPQPPGPTDPNVPSPHFPGPHFALTALPSLQMVYSFFLLSACQDIPRIHPLYISFNSPIPRHGDLPFEIFVPVPSV